MNKLFPVIRRTLHTRSFSSTTTRMNAFVERQQQAEKTIDLLKQQIAVLVSIAEQKQKIAEKEEIQKLRKENEQAEKQVQKLKYDLRFYESQNGVKQIAVPEKSTPVASTPTTVEETPKPSQPAPSSGDKKNEKAKASNENKKDKKKANKENKAPKAAAEGAKPIDVSRLNLKIGKIIDVKRHPDADGLFMETVEFGEEKPRTILSGLVKHYTLEQMKDRTAIFLCNLKPQKMRGIASEGMIMCASTPEKVEIITPPEGAAIGDRVICPQFAGEPDGQLNPKKKIWEQVAPDLAVDDEGFASYKGNSLVIEGKGKCKAPTMTKCPIK
ncbi:aminoacyl tRNA synthase complex-interacting multifunctional protein 1-like [Clytia hemisphaerica]